MKESESSRFCRKIIDLAVSLIRRLKPFRSVYSPRLNTKSATRFPIIITPSQGDEDLIRGLLRYPELAVDPLGVKEISATMAPLEDSRYVFWSFLQNDSNLASSDETIKNFN